MLLICAFVNIFSCVISKKPVDCGLLAEKKRLTSIRNTSMAENRSATVSKHTSVTARKLHSIGKQYAFLGVVFIASVTLIASLAVTSFTSRTHRQHDVRAARLCCLILTAPKYLTTRAKAVNDTWAPRCDRYFFITELPRENMTLEQLHISDRLPIAPIPGLLGGYDHLTLKTTLALLYIYEHHRDEFDWFVKADDDTYLLVDHLKAFLSKQKSSEPVTFGYTFEVRTRAVSSFTLA